MEREVGWTGGCGCYIEVERERSWSREREEWKLKQHFCGSLEGEGEVSRGRSKWWVVVVVVSSKYHLTIFGSVHTPMLL